MRRPDPTRKLCIWTIGISLAIAFAARWAQSLFTPEHASTIMDALFVLGVMFYAVASAAAAALLAELFLAWRQARLSCELGPLDIQELERIHELQCGRPR